VAFTRVYRDGDHFYAQSTARPVAEVFPESPTEFFLTAAAATRTEVVSGFSADGKIAGIRFGDLP
jgi:hypothetical protein